MTPDESYRELWLLFCPARGEGSSVIPVKFLYSGNWAYWTCTNLTRY